MNRKRPSKLAGSFLGFAFLAGLWKGCDRIGNRARREAFFLRPKFARRGNRLRRRGSHCWELGLGL